MGEKGHMCHTINNKKYETNSTISPQETERIKTRNQWYWNRKTIDKVNETKNTVLLKNDSINKLLTRLTKGGKIKTQITNSRNTPILFNKALTKQKRP